MRIEHLFTTPLLVETVNLKNIKKLKLFCSSQEKKFPSRQVSNRGGWQSDLMSEKDYGDSLGADLYTMFSFYIQKYCEYLKPRIEIEISKSWININRNTDYNIKHIHPLSVFSGAFYVSVPTDNKSEIIFNRPSMLEEYFYQSILCDPNPSSTFSVNFSPVEGMILIFPSYLEHHVTPSFSKQKRISISFNTKIKNYI